MSINPFLTPAEIMDHAKLALAAVASLTPEQQQAVLEAAAAGARANVELRRSLYVTGSILASINRK